MPETMTIPRTRQGVRDLDRIGGDVLPVSGGPAPGTGAGVNVGPTEQLLSSFAGASLALVGLARGGLCGLGMALAGGALLYRGLTGRCSLYRALGVSTAAPRGAEVVYRAH
jgi:uncharacterized membrane protein